MPRGISLTLGLALLLGWPAVAAPSRREPEPTPQRVQTQTPSPIQLYNQGVEQLQALGSPLVEELEYVFERGEEKEPEQFFGVSGSISE